MGTKETSDVLEEWPTPTSPYRVLQQLSEDAGRVAGEALRSVAQGPGHRRSRSDVLTPSLHRQSNNFQKWKSQMQRAFRWGSSSHEEGYSPSFNPEILANQKRQWYQLNSKTLDYEKYREPNSLFEHFIVVGLHPDSNLDVVEDAFVRRKKWELQVEKSEMIDLRLLRHQRPSLPTLEPQILFKYPPGKKFAMRPEDLSTFCFPDGVKARVLERTPSLSELNEIIYGQEHLSRDDSSFIFSLKVADNATLYGVCLHVQEFVQRSPAICGAASPLSQSSVRCSRFLVSARRCYCILTRVPFFELHYEMLNSIIAQERLNRITQFVTEMSLSDAVPSPSKSSDQTNENIDSPYRDHVVDWMASAIPVDSAMALTAAAAGIISDVEVPSSSSRWEISSPMSVTASETSNHSQARDMDDDGRRNIYYSLDGYTSEASENRCDSVEKMCGLHENGHTSDAGSNIDTRTLERVGSCESLFSSAISMVAEDDDAFFSTHDKDSGNTIILEWARENKNDLLQIVCSYHSVPLPPRGSRIIFQPLEHLQAVEYQRPLASELGVSEHIDLQTDDKNEVAKAKFKLAAAEEAAALSIWTTATACRVLSLENILALVAGVLLEKQVVVLCQNLGILSALVLSLIPLIRPFQWQSLFLPVLPEKMLDFLDAPVPYIVGIQHKPAELKMKSSNGIFVNVAKDQVKTCYVPALPRRKELISELGTIHARLSREGAIAQRHPVFKCNEEQAEAAAQFLIVMRRYLESLCSDLRSHTITNVQSNDDKVSILLRDSFIDSFPSRDQPFIKLFVDTQLFTVLSDSRLSGYENE